MLLLLNMCILYRQTVLYDKKQSDHVQNFSMYFYHIELWEDSILHDQDKPLMRTPRS